MEAFDWAEFPETLTDSSEPRSFIEAELRLPEKRRPWSASSQCYAPADVLLEHLRDHWRLSATVGLERRAHGGGRWVDVFFFELTKGGQAVVMPVVSNPVVRRLLKRRKFRIVPLTFEAERERGSAAKSRPRSAASDAAMRR